MTQTRNAPKDIDTEATGFGIVFANGVIHGPTPVDNRGLGGSTKDKIAFMVVPGPESPYFHELDLDLDGIQAFKDRDLGFWSIRADTEERAHEIVAHINRNGGI